MLTLSGLPNPKFTSTEEVGAELSISAAEVPRSNRHETFVCQTMLRDLSVRGDGVMPDSFSSLRFLNGSSYYLSRIPRIWTAFHYLLSWPITSGESFQSLSLQPINGNIYLRKVVRVIVVLFQYLFVVLCVAAFVVLLISRIKRFNVFFRPLVVCSWCFYHRFHFWRWLI